MRESAAAPVTQKNNNPFFSSLPTPHHDAPRVFVFWRCASCPQQQQRNPKNVKIKTNEFFSPKRLLQPRPARAAPQMRTNEAARGAMYVHARPTDGARERKCTTRHTRTRERRVRCCVLCERGCFFAFLVEVRNQRQNFSSNKGSRVEWGALLRCGASRREDVAHERARLLAAPFLLSRVAWC